MRQGGGIHVKVARDAHTNLVVVLYTIVHARRQTSFLFFCTDVCIRAQVKYIVSLYMRMCVCVWGVNI